MQLMSFRRPLLDSLRRKTLFGFAAIALLVAALSAFLLVEMRLLEAQIRVGEQINRFFGTVLEMRRFEKNFFLYRQASDLAETRDYLTQARAILAADGEEFARFAGEHEVSRLRTGLDTYADLLTEGAAHETRRQARIREVGKELATIAEEWTRRERALLQEQLDRHRQRLLWSIAIIVIAVLAIGRLLAAHVARPLRILERRMDAVAAGESAKLDLDGQDREIAALTAAFNRVLHELELHQRQLLRAERLASLGTLLSGVAHELNNPLSNVSTSCQILAEEVDAGGTALQRDLITQIDAETWRARRIVSTLLDYARDRPFRRDAVALRALVDDSLRLLRTRLPPQVELVVDIDPGLVVKGDRQRLQQVLFNVVANAGDSIEGDGNIVISATQVRDPWPADALVFGHGRGDAPAIELAVTDSGQGIPAAIRPRIFDPFFTTKEVGHGLGLGLFIVFEIVEEHDGTIAVQDASGGGTRIALRLPTAEGTP